MNLFKNKNYISKILVIICILFWFGIIFVQPRQVLAAELNVNILAVNGTEEGKEKDINFHLPPELTAEDILDTAGLKLEYDIDSGSYAVKGMVRLKAKETKTYKIRIRDIWKVDDAQIEEIQKQINASLDHLKSTEYYETGKMRKEGLMQRLDAIVNTQKKYADNVEKRIDSHRIYAHELEEIRSNAISGTYWRTEAPKVEDSRLFTYIIEVENPLKDKSQTIEPKHYLPAEVKPEHLVDLQGFDLRYDAIKGRSYLSKEETLKPSEKKKYEIQIIDVWNINQKLMDNLRDRARSAFRLLEHSQYADSAIFLIKSIKNNLDKIEASQSIEKGISEHISTFRVNTKRFENAKNDVEALEDLLKVIKEDLERSKLKNVLQRIQSLKSIGDVADAVFGKKPTLNTAWKIIMWLVGFVFVMTIIHFVIWGGRSKAVKIEEKKEDEEASSGKMDGKN